MKRRSAIYIAIGVAIVGTTVLVLSSGNKSLSGSTTNGREGSPARIGAHARPAGLERARAQSSSSLPTPKLAVENMVASEKMSEPKPTSPGRQISMETAVAEVLSSPSFAAFSRGAHLESEQEHRIAEILALTRLNTDAARKSIDPTVRSLIPGRVRKDAEVRIAMQLAPEQREVFAREKVLASLLPENSEK